MQLVIALMQAIENTWKDAFITSYHIIYAIIYASMISFFLLMHIGPSEGITLLEFDEEPEEQQEAPQLIAPKGEEQALEDLPECPDYRTTSFIKGKP